MGFSASVIILVVIICRALFINRLPKKVFLVLWLIVLLRLLVPYSFPSVCIIPANLMEASRTDKTNLPVSTTSKDINVKKVNTSQKKANNPDITTNFTEEEQKRLLKEYKEQGIKQKNGILYYENKPVRCFTDIYREKSYNAYGGVTTNYKSVYSYFNEDGKTDVYVERESIKTGEEWSYGKVITQGQALEDFIFAIPQEYINKMLDKSARKGNYKDIETFIIFAGQESIDRAANQIVANGDYEVLENIIWNVSPKTRGAVAVQLAEKGKYSALQCIISFLESGDLKKVADILCKKEAYNAFCDIAWALKGNIIDGYAKQFAEKGEYDVVCNIACFLSQDVTGEIAGQIAENKKYDELRSIICFVSGADADKIAEKLYEKGEYEGLGVISWNISKSILEKLAKKMAENGDYDALVSIAPYLAWNN